MTEQELIEKIAIRVATAYFEMWDWLEDEHRNNWRKWTREKIYPLIKEAGYKSPEECRICLDLIKFPDSLDFQQGVDLGRRLAKEEMMNAGKAPLLTDEEKEIAVQGIPACGDNPVLNIKHHKHAADRISKSQNDADNRFYRGEGNG